MSIREGNELFFFKIDIDSLVAKSANPGLTESGSTSRFARDDQLARRWLRVHGQANTLQILNIPYLMRNLISSGKCSRDTRSHSPITHELYLCLRMA